MSKIIELGEGYNGVIERAGVRGFDWRITRSPGVQVQVGNAAREDVAEGDMRAVFNGLMAQGGFDGIAVDEQHQEFTKRGVEPAGEADKRRAEQIAEGDEDQVADDQQDDQARQTESESKPKRGALPEDFPYRSFLEAGGVTTHAQLRKRIDAGTLTEIANIGDERAVKITEAAGE